MNVHATNFARFFSVVRGSVVIRAVAVAFGMLTVTSCKSSGTRPEMPVLVTTTAALTNAPAAALPPAPAAPLPPDAFQPFTPSDYRLAVGDVVEVSVFGERDTVAVTPIAPDGKLYYMFTNGIPAVGRKPEEVALDIQTQLTRLFNNPHVDILPKIFASKKYLVLGKVNYPGIMPLDAAMTLRQALARAGGLAQGSYRGTTIEVASLRESYILRDGRRLPVDFEALMNRNDASQDVYMRPGDVVYIASSLSHSREVYLLGAMPEQRAVAYRDNMTMIELITGASEQGGGYLPTANLKRVVILRGALNDPKTTEVDVQAIMEGRAPDQYVQPGDVVYVPEKPFRFAQDLAKAIVMTFVKSFSGNAGSTLMQETFFPKASTGNTTVVTGGAGP